ncbi:putative lipid II flippase FtsW [Gorillibacterium sp. sgz5001074]|uniref:putative lipid II flippase FtsW n=1 Tax=Gorillibacterium sp. sgz5001074 TaxID=3446695 RepID=UPI003F680161
MNPSRRGTPDYLLLFLTLALSAFGVLMVFSASSMSAIYHRDGNALFYTQKQVLGIVLGIIGMVVTMNIHYTKLRKMTLPFGLFVLFLLILVPIIGVNVNGARSWFKIGPLQLQPAEFAKVAIVMYLAAIISKKQDKFRSFRGGLLPALVMVGLVSGLILLQPDLGSTIVLCLGALLVMIVGGANLKHLFLLAAGGTALFAIVGGIMLLANPSLLDGSYRLARITTYLDPWSDERNAGYHIVQSLYAFGHGGFTGAGFGQSIQKLHFLPAPHNDFIFAIIGEELGFIGGSLFLLAYLLFIWRGIIVSLRCSDTYASLVGIGIIGTIGIQALINLGGVTNSIPLTGVTLPLISYGGSSMLVTLSSMGIILGISRDYNRAADAEAPDKPRRSGAKSGRTVTG